MKWKVSVVTPAESSPSLIVFYTIVAASPTIDYHLPSRRWWVGGMATKLPLLWIVFVLIQFCSSVFLIIWPFDLARRGFPLGRRRHASLPSAVSPRIVIRWFFPLFSFVLQSQRQSLRLIELSLSLSFGVESRRRERQSKLMMRRPHEMVISNLKGGNARISKPTLVFFSRQTTGPFATKKTLEILFFVSSFLVVFLCYRHTTQVFYTRRGQVLFCRAIVFCAVARFPNG